jgi:hypothetical protein
MPRGTRQKRRSHASVAMSQDVASLCTVPHRKPRLSSVYNSLLNRCLTKKHASKRFSPLLSRYNSTAAQSQLCAVRHCWTRINSARQKPSWRNIPNVSVTDQSVPGTGRPIVSILQTWPARIACRVAENSTGGASFSALSGVHYFCFDRSWSPCPHGHSIGVCRSARLRSPRAAA